MLVRRTVIVKPKQYGKFKHFVRDNVRKCIFVYNELINFYLTDRKFRNYKKELKRLIQNNGDKSRIVNLKTLLDNYSFTRMSKRNLYKYFKMLKETNAFLQDVPSVFLNSVFRRAMRTIENFKNKKTKNIKIKKKYSKFSITFTQCKIEHLDIRGRHGKVFIPKFGFINVRGFRKNLQIQKLHEVIVTLHSDGLIMISLSVTAKRNPRPFKYKDILGIDLNASNVLATSKGQIYPKLDLKSLESQITEIQQELAKYRKVRNKKRYKQRLRHKLVRLWRKVRNKRKKYQYQITQGLLEYEVIVIEDLKIKEMVSNNKLRTKQDPSFIYYAKRTNKSFLENTPGKLVEILTYKREETGTYIQKVNPVNTSRRCYECRYVDERNRNGHKFKCLRCGHEEHADINAARNIRKLGIDALGYKVAA